MLPSMTINGPKPPAQKQPHTITEPLPNFCVVMTWHGWYRSQSRWITRASPSLPTAVNLDSSNYITLLHLSIVQYDGGMPKTSS